MNTKLMIGVIGFVLLVGFVFLFRSPASPPVSDEIADVPEQVTITGIWECLPHIGNGPHTLECALGVAKDASDAHYAIDTQFMSQGIVDFPTGTHVKVEGMLTPVEQLSSVQKYDIDGVISATSISPL